MGDSIFQSIIDILTDILPAKWERLIYRADYAEGSYSMKYYVDLGDKKYTDCFKLGTPSKSQILATFRKLNTIIAPDRQTLSSKEKWSVMTIKIEPSGKFKADFDYTDISERPISYQESWEKKYLN